MNETQILELLAAEDTFGADTQLPSTVWSHTAAFAEVERLIATVPETTPLGWPARNRRFAFLAAAGAFAVVLLIGVALALLARSGGETQPVATTAPPPSTTVIPSSTSAPVGDPIEVETRQLLGSLERLYNRGDGDAVGQLLATDAAVALAPGVTAAESPSVGSLSQRATSGAMYGERIRFGECLNFGPEIRCKVTIADRFSGLLSLEPWMQTWTVEILDGEITRLEVTGDHPERAAAMADFSSFIDERSTGDVASVVIGELEWNRTPEGHATFDEFVVLYTALANGVSADAYELISEFHSALSAGDIEVAEAQLAPGGQYRPAEQVDETSAGVYGGSIFGSAALTEYFEFWYRMLQTDWVPIGCSGDATTVTCSTESRGLMTLFLPGGVASGVVIYTLGPEGIVTVEDRTVRTGGSCGPSACADDGLDLRGFWRSWMPENAPEVELLWPEGNGDPPVGFTEEFAAAIWDYYPQFLAENGIDVPPEYLDGSAAEALRQASG